MAEKLTASSTVGTWLKDPVGGPIVRRYLPEAGVDEKVLAPVSFLPLEQAAALSGGRVTREMIDGLVAEAAAG
jgi:hypothetical protein